MNTTELETIIRNILREQMMPTASQTQRNGIFQAVDDAVCAAHQAFCAFNSAHLKPAVPLSTPFAKSYPPALPNWQKRALSKRGWEIKKISI